MNRLNHTLFALTSATLLVGISACDMLNQAPQGPYPTGLVVELEATEERETRYFKSTGGGSPEERKGTIGLAGGCETAASSSGDLKITHEGESVYRFEVLGQTETSHPLNPDSREFGAAGVSVVEAWSTFEGKQTVYESFRVPGGDPATWETQTEDEIALSTDAAYSGIASDEYVVRLSSLGDLWTDLEDEDAEIDSELLTRTAPQAGDIWASLDGNTLFVSDGMEEISMPDGKADAHKVSVFTVAGVDHEADGVAEQCINETDHEYQTTHEDEDNDRSRRANLDPGCAASFVHQQVGTEWWVDNVLVKSEKTFYEVEIMDYGYEWYEDDGDCVRYTSLTLDDNDARLFVEYSVTEVTQEMHATEFEVKEGDDDDED